MRLGSQGGSNTSCTSTSATPGSCDTLLLTSSTSTDPTPQPGAVNLGEIAPQSLNVTVVTLRQSFNQDDQSPGCFTKQQSVDQLLLGHRKDDLFDIFFDLVACC